VLQFYSEPIGLGAGLAFAIFKYEVTNVFEYQLGSTIRVSVYDHA